MVNINYNTIVLVVLSLQLLIYLIIMNVEAAQAQIDDLTEDILNLDINKEESQSSDAQCSTSIFGEQIVMLNSCDKLLCTYELYILILYISV